MDYFLSILFLAPTMLLALTFHEYAHGWVANRLGDPTAKLLGRLSMNPLVHLDLFGTILLPILLIISKAPFVFGWAKPVPIDPFNLRHPRKDMIWVGLAGPAANLLLALISGLTFRLLLLGGVRLGSTLDFLLFLLASFVLINLVFSAFNLIPIPPLDGSRFVAGILPLPLARQYIQLERFGMILLIILFVVGQPVIAMFVGPFLGFFGTLFAGYDIWSVMEKLQNMLRGMG